MHCFLPPDWELFQEINYVIVTLCIHWDLTIFCWMNDWTNEKFITNFRKVFWQSLMYSSYNISSHLRSVFTYHLYSYMNEIKYYKLLYFRKWFSGQLLFHLFVLNIFHLEKKNFYKTSGQETPHWYIFYIFHENSVEFLNVQWNWKSVLLQC